MVVPYKHKKEIYVVNCL